MTAITNDISKENDIEKCEDDYMCHSQHDVSISTPSDANQGATPIREHDEAYKVDWEPNEPGNPRNWRTSKKIWVVFLLGQLALAASLASAIISPASEVIASTFHVSKELTILNTSLFVLGFAVGPSVWAPMSELYGRRISIVPAMFVLALFSVGTATSQTIASILITRFFAGVFGSAPVSNVGAALGDMYVPKVRGAAIACYAIAVVGGVCMAPLIGSAVMVDPRLGWRWIEYLIAIWSFTICILAGVGMPEVYGPVLLKRKAQRLRIETGDDRYWHPHELQKVDVRSILTKHLSRPVLMLTTEPIVTCIALYASFVFSLLYMTLEIFPIAFSQQRQWSPVVASLPFLSLFIGVLCTVPLNLANQPRYARLVEANNGKAVPEGRLPPMALGAAFFTLGIFWFSWTAGPVYHWILPVIAIAFIGAGFNMVFQQCINFLVDCYGLYAASAVSANTMLRSLMGAGLPFAAPPMFNSLGIGPAGSILGAIAALALPVPFIFMRYGATIRSYSKFAQSGA